MSKLGTDKNYGFIAMVFLVSMIIIWFGLVYYYRHHELQSINVPEAIASYMVQESLDSMKEKVLLQASDPYTSSKKLQKEALEAIKYDSEKSYSIKKLASHITKESCSSTLDTSGTCYVSIHIHGESRKYLVLFVHGKVQSVSKQEA